VLGAAFSGFAVVAMIAVALRHALGLGDLVTRRHLDLLGIFLLATGLMTAFGYWAEVFDTLYAGEQQDLETLRDRFFGVYAFSYWGAIAANFLPLQLLWWRRIRSAPLPLFLIGLSVAVGMWFERYMLLTTSLYRDYLVSSWRDYSPSIWEWAIFAGMLGVFLTPFLLFVRFLPVISAFEVKTAVFDAREERHA
jgi:molybdopterin-containing oxidoreductase family membrane subunit